MVSVTIQAARTFYDVIRNKKQLVSMIPRTDSEYCWVEKNFVCKFYQTIVNVVKDLIETTQSSCLLNQNLIHKFTDRILSEYPVVIFSNNFI